jgi:hypothetical protein
MYVNYFNRINILLCLQGNRKVLWQNYFNRIKMPLGKSYLVDTTRENEIYLLHSARKTF